MTHHSINISCHLECRSLANAADCLMILQSIQPKHPVLVLQLTRYGSMSLLLAGAMVSASISDDSGLGAVVSALVNS